MHTVAASRSVRSLPIGTERRRELLGERDIQRLANVAAELGFDVLADLKNRDSGHIPWGHLYRLSLKSTESGEV